MAGLICVDHLKSICCMYHLQVWEVNYIFQKVIAVSKIKTKNKELPGHKTRFWNIPKPVYHQTGMHFRKKEVRCSKEPGQAACPWGPNSSPGTRTRPGLTSKWLISRLRPVGTMTEKGNQFLNVLTWKFCLLGSPLGKTHPKVSCVGSNFWSIYSKTKMWDCEWVLFLFFFCQALPLAGWHICTSKFLR